MFYNPLETNIGHVKKRKKDLLIKDDFPRKNCGDLMPLILRLTTLHFSMGSTGGHRCRAIYDNPSLKNIRTICLQETHARKTLSQKYVSQNVERAPTRLMHIKPNCFTVDNLFLDYVQYSTSLPSFFLDFVCWASTVDCVLPCLHVSRLFLGVKEFQCTLISLCLRGNNWYHLS